MERIKKAVEIAKANREKLQDRPTVGAPPRTWIETPTSGPAQARNFSEGTTVRFNKWHLQANRIVGDDPADPRGRSYEMLRTHVMQKAMETGHRVIGITSPGAACGKTLTAVNLALSLARLPEATVTLADLDLRKPQVAGYLGLRPGPGMENYLRGEAKLSEIAVLPESSQRRLRILPTFKPSRDSAEFLGSAKMKDVVTQLRAQDHRGLMVIDLPPVLVVDDVLSFLPNLDAVLVVAAYGQTTTADLVSTERLIGSDKIMGVILNKSEDNVATNPYY
jgi:protein-tyrosine kinase